MIVYNVRHRFFAMKADADTHRKAHGLPPSSIVKLEISNRDELAAFLDRLMLFLQPDTEDSRPELEVLKDAPYMTDIDNLPEYIPEFMKRDYEKRNNFAKE